MDRFTPDPSIEGETRMLQKSWEARRKVGLLLHAKVTRGPSQFCLSIPLSKYCQKCSQLILCSHTYSISLANSTIHHSRQYFLRSSDLNLGMILLIPATQQRPDLVPTSWNHYLVKTYTHASTYVYAIGWICVHYICYRIYTEKKCIIYLLKINTRWLIPWIIALWRKSQAMFEYSLR